MASPSPSWEQAQDPEHIDQISHNRGGTGPDRAARITRKPVPASSDNEDVVESNPASTLTQSVQADNAGSPLITSAQAVPTNITLSGVSPAAEQAFEKEQSKFASGRLPLKQTAWTWLLAAVTIAFYILTVCYALGTTKLRFFFFAALKPSNTLLVLRVLSEVTRMLTALLILICSERALWMLIAQKEGTCLSAFLALGPGSGLWSWINMLNIRGSRSLSWLSLLTALLPPAMSIALLSQVEIQPFFIDQTTFPVAAGVGDFNATYASSEFALIAATKMASDFSALLQTNEVSLGVPVVTPDHEPCDSLDIFSTDYCGTGYFLHGGTTGITPWPSRNVLLPSVPVYTVHSIRGLQLDFSNLASGAIFAGDTDCLIFGTDDAAIRFCVSQASSNAVNAKLIACPVSLIGTCLRDKSWYSASGFTMTMQVYSRHADVHFWRRNASTISVTDMSAPIEQKIFSNDILTVFNTTLNAKTGLGALVSAAGQFVTFISTYVTLAQTSSSTAAQAIQKLHNLMAIPVYYFQPLYISPYTIVPSPDRVLDKLPPDQGLYVTASLSTIYYGLSIAIWSVWLYTAVMAVLLLSCILVLALGTLPKSAAGLPDTTPWSFVDFVAETGISHRDSEDREPASEEPNIHLVMRRLGAAEGRSAKAKIMASSRMTLHRPSP